MAVHMQLPTIGIHVATISAPVKLHRFLSPFFLLPCLFRLWCRVCSRVGAILYTKTRAGVSVPSIAVEGGRGGLHTGLLGAEPRTNLFKWSKRKCSQTGRHREQRASIALTPCVWREDLRGFASFRDIRTSEAWLQ